MMKKKNHQCSPLNLETTTNLVQKGAQVYGTAYGISIPTPGHGIPSGPLSSPGVLSILESVKIRIPPVIRETQSELARRGVIAIPVRGGSRIPLDIIACLDRSQAADRSV